MGTVRVNMTSTAVLLLLTIPCLAAAQCIINSDDQNVVSTQLVGTWQVDMELSLHLNEDPHVSEDLVISFTDNPSIADNLPEEDCNEWLTGFTLFMAGEVTYVT